MNVVLGFLVVIVVAAITVAAMLLVRRRAPEGSYFTDGDRASVFSPPGSLYSWDSSSFSPSSPTTTPALARRLRRSSSKRRSTCRPTRPKSSPAN
jgi:hypothetical protein